MRVLMSRPRLGVTFAVLAPFVLMGCEAALQGQPRATLDDSRPSLNTLVIGGTLSQANVNAALVNQTDGKRNAIVLARVAELDTLYNEYENTLLFEARQSGFCSPLQGLWPGWPDHRPVPPRPRTIRCSAAGSTRHSPLMKKRSWPSKP